MTTASPYWRGKCVAVTGGTGFLGFHIVQLLASSGAKVRVLALPNSAAKATRAQQAVQMRWGDILDAEFVRTSLEDCEVVFHTAGIVAVWGAAVKRVMPVHIDGTRNVVTNCAAGARVVHTSSIVAVGATRHGEVLDEGSPFTLDKVAIDYVHAKRAAERICLEAAARGQWVTMTCPGYLIGPNDYDHSIMGRYCLRYWRGRVPVVGPGGLNLVDVRDVARGHLLAAERGQSGRRYILGGENLSMREFTLRLAIAAGWRPRAYPRIPLWLLHVLAQCAELRAALTEKEPYPSRQHVELNSYHWFASSARARRELGFNARCVQESLNDAYRWHQSRTAISLRGLKAWWMRPNNAHAA